MSRFLRPSEICIFWRSPHTLRPAALEVSSFHITCSTLPPLQLLEHLELNLGYISTSTWSLNGRAPQPWPGCLSLGTIVPWLAFKSISMLLAQCVPTSTLSLLLHSDGHPCWLLALCAQKDPASLSTLPLASVGSICSGHELFAC